MSIPAEKPTIIAWLKPSCGWSQGVRAVFRKYDLPFEDRDIINNSDNYQEMVSRTGQMNQPSVEINGHVLADVSGEEIEAWMLKSGVVSTNERGYDAPINEPCPNELPGAAQPSGIAFRR